jgi:hypothetical protein
VRPQRAAARAATSAPRPLLPTVDEGVGGEEEEGQLQEALHPDQALEPVRHVAHLRAAAAAAVQPSVLACVRLAPPWRPAEQGLGRRRRMHRAATLQLGRATQHGRAAALTSVSPFVSTCQSMACSAQPG